MKKILLISFFLTTMQVWSSENIVNVYTWADYLPESIIDQFQKETGITINHSTYLNNEALYAKLKSNSKAGYDVIIPSNYFIKRLAKQNLIQKIDFSRLTEFKNINPDFLNKDYDLNNEHGVPYLWTSTGITVNKKYFPNHNITAWKDLWSSRFKDQLLMLDDTREVFSVALMALGYSVNETNPDHIKEAFEKLKSLMTNVKIFSTEGQRAIYLDEDISIGMAWNGNIYSIISENPNLEFIYPQEGYVISLDCLAIPQYAPHIENAYRFINFLLRTDISAKVSIENGYSSANYAGMQLLPEEMRNSFILYPNAQLMKKAKFIMDIGESAKLYEKYYERFKLSAD